MRCCLCRRLAVEIGDKAVEPDQIEEERILARAGEYRDRTILRNYRHFWRRIRRSLSGEPIDDDVVREKRPVGLTRGIGCETWGIVIERREDEIDRRGRDALGDRVGRGAEVETIKRIRLEMVGNAEARIRYRLGAQHDDKIAASTGRVAAGWVAEHVDVVDVDRAVVVDCWRVAVVGRHRRHRQRDRKGRRDPEHDSPHPEFRHRFSPCSLLRS